MMIFARQLSNLLFALAAILAAATVLGSDHIAVLLPGSALLGAALFAAVFFRMFG